MPGRYTPRTVTPKARALRIFNRMTDYCCDTWKGNCKKCDYVDYCVELSEAGIRTSHEIMYAQRTKEQRAKITDVINKLDKQKKRSEQK